MTEPLKGTLGAHSSPRGGQGRGWWFHFPDEEISSERSTTCPGLHSQKVAELRSPVSGDSVLSSTGKYKWTRIFQSFCLRGLRPYLAGAHVVVAAASPLESPAFSKAPFREKLPPSRKATASFSEVRLPVQAPNMYFQNWGQPVLGT